MALCACAAKHGKRQVRGSEVHGIVSGQSLERGGECLRSLLHLDYPVEHRDVEGGVAPRARGRVDR